MDPMLPEWFDWFDAVVTYGGLVGILWAGLRQSKLNAPPVVLIGVVVWLAAMGVAMFRIIGPDR